MMCIIYVIYVHKAIFYNHRKGASVGNHTKLHSATYIQRIRMVCNMIELSHHA